MLEFVDAVDTRSEEHHYDRAKQPTGKDDGGEVDGCFVGAFNKFGLQLGQWTDDCSMALCIADSLIERRRFDGSDLRVRSLARHQKQNSQTVRGCFAKLLL